MAKFVVWHACFEGPNLEMLTAESIEEAFEKAFPENEIEEDQDNGIRCLRCGDDTVVGWNTDAEKEQTIHHLFENNWAAYMDDDEKADAATQENFGFYYPLPDEVYDAFAKKLEKEGF